MRKIQVSMCAMMVAVTMAGCGQSTTTPAPEKEPAPQTQEVQQETNVAQEETTEAATEETTPDYVVLEDGTYSTNFITENEDGMAYIKSIEFTEDGVILEASLVKVHSIDWSDAEDMECNKYFIPTSASTSYISGGGEQDPTSFGRSEFDSYLQGAMSSGLGLSFKIENGVATEIGIWS